MCEERKPRNDTNVSKKPKPAKNRTLNGYRCRVTELKRLLIPYNENKIMELLIQNSVATNYMFVRRTDFWGSQSDEFLRVCDGYRKSHSSIYTLLQITGMRRGCKVMLNDNQYHLLQSILDKTH